MRNVSDDLAGPGTPSAQMLVQSKSASRRALSDFEGKGYEKGRHIVVQAIWFAVMNLFFMKWWFPKALRPVLLRLFGARVGKNVNIRHRVRVLWPWKLAIGNNSWIGEDVWLLNLEPIKIGSDVCLSQAASLITGSHDRNSRTFEYDNGPIEVRDGAWVAFGATVLRNVVIGEGAVISACALAVRSVAPNEVYR